MQRIVTITERKAAEAARRTEAVAALLPVLSEYARAHGGQFLLFGSAARGQMKFTSDVDLLMDFPPETLDEAWKFAEAACWDRDLKPDLIPYRWCRQAFLEHVAADARVLE
jgi:predicted nucleotidyltransferase